MNIRRAEARDMVVGAELVVTTGYDNLAVVRVIDIMDPYDPHAAFRDTLGDTYGLDGAWVLVTEGAE